MDTAYQTNVARASPDCLDFVAHSLGNDVLVTSGRCPASLSRPERCQAAATDKDLFHADDMPVDGKLALWDRLERLMWQWSSWGYWIDGVSLAYQIGGRLVLRGNAYVGYLKMRGAHRQVHVEGDASLKTDGFVVLRESVLVKPIPESNRPSSVRPLLVAVDAEILELVVAGRTQAGPILNEAQYDGFNVCHLGASPVCGQHDCSGKQAARL
jgi:hypothetical protein